MYVPQRIWRAALARALFVATTLTATPAIACDGMAAGDLARRLPEARRHELEGSLVPPFVALWQELRGKALPAAPDGIEVFAAPGHPLLVAFRRGGCLLALLPIPPAELWRALRRHVGPIA
jgi:hypothetical protein